MHILDHAFQAPEAVGVCVFETSIFGTSWWGLGCHGQAGSTTHPVHCLSDEEVVSEAFEEGKWLVYGIGNLQLLVYELLEKSVF